MVVERQPRVGRVLPVRFRNAGQFLVAYATNLSRGGLFVATETPAAVGTTIDLALEVPGFPGAPEVRALVKWRREHDDDDGPAGMGLEFADVEASLGTFIDRMVTQAAPLRIGIVARGDRASRHLTALVHSLVNCEVREHTLEPGEEKALARRLAAFDLVLVDVDEDPRPSLAFLQALAARKGASPALALCNARDTATRAGASGYATVVGTPVDKQDLQESVLKTLSMARSRDR